MILRGLLFLLPFLLLTTHILSQAAQKAPERELADFFSVLTAKELRDLAASRDKVEEAGLSGAMNLHLSVKEKGKRWTVHCISSGKTTEVMDNVFSLYSDASRSLVRVNGERLYVQVAAQVDKILFEKLKECRRGRKIFVSGTVDSILITKTSAAGNGMGGHITLKVDDIGLDKQ